MNPAGYADYVLSGSGLYVPNPTIPINTGTPDENGCYWWYKTLKGWAAPDARVTMLPLISQEGEIPADLHYRGRSVQMTGWVECPSEAAREAARYMLTGTLDALNPIFPGTFQAREADHARNIFFVHSGNNATGLASFDECGFGIRAAAELVRYAGFRQITDAVITGGSPTVTSATAAFTNADVGQIVWDLSGRIPVGTTILAVNSSTNITLSQNANTSGNGVPMAIGASGGLPNGLVAYLADWEFEIYAPDPRKYSTTAHTANFAGGTVSVPNAGNTPSQSLIVQLTPAGNNPLVLSSSFDQPFSMTLQAVSPHTMPSSVIINFSARTITDGSFASRYDLLVPGTPWGVLSPGPNLLTVSPSVAGTVVWSDTWV